MLTDTLRQHGVRHLAEAGDVGTVQQVAGDAVFHGGVVDVVEDVQHDLMQALVYLVEGPCQAHTVLAHLQTADGHAAGVGGLGGGEQDAALPQHLDGGRGAGHIGPLRQRHGTAADDAPGRLSVDLILGGTGQGHVAGDGPQIPEVAAELAAGDQLGILPDAATAAELRYSETAFIKPLGGNRFHIRYFTPAAEVELCGHATIGSFHALQEMGLVAEGGTYIDETLSGTLEVVVGKDAILMDMAKPQTFQRLETPEELEELYRIMGLSADGQGAVTGKPELMLLPQKVSTGLTDIMMPVADEAELEKIAPDFPALTEHSRRYNVVGVHAFTVNTADGMIHARNFAPLYDIDEEAATGTSNGALVYYLYRHGLVELDKVYTVVQGEKMGRPSMISAQVILKDGLPFVKVGGPAVTLVRGEIEL